MAIPGWAGPMRHRIEVQRPEITRQADGSKAIAWTVYFRAQAEFEERRPREPYEAGRDITKAQGMFRLRYRRDKQPTSDMRIVHRGEVWEIERVENVMAGNHTWKIHTTLRTEDEA